MRLLDVAALAACLAGCSGEQCLEVLTEGVQPSTTTWVTWAGYDGTATTPRSTGGQQGQLPGGYQTASCARPGIEGTWRLVVWFDDSGASPFDTYCNGLGPEGLSDCSPRTGQPFGEKSFFFAASGLTTVTVTIHPP